MEEEEWVRVCDAGSLSSGELVEFDHRSKKLMVAKMGNDVYATDRICTHAYADLTGGFVNEGEKTVTCPLHLSAFKLTDGAPQNPPATAPLKTYKVKIQDNAIYIKID
ncbi:non-heme iron oxygenase ferredoxin subunit [Nitrososphaera viennensis]|uniref:Rieske 2Fe-2S iron-sulfur domain-containing protein n=2 Tax=Nitrososphaera viennensis TaxID=1034015 RepID=A0A060HIY2_9ARCH|nr:non-heme iron oxygenase ferredoxin subunit [Nitrososphaera viennensis]AIC15478.1 rieske 2Fe-2S iron-sulfur domain-containing protein [Nitrososphaera viennensis EN76]UVS70367.1 non-heme iron oxygenase ferredoxin subunit [Nitrososphaera viennensis]